MRFAVGMSGGVDSSVAALLLVRAGHEVTGLTMRTWAGDEGPGRGRGACYGRDEAGDIRAAESVCARLGVPLRVFDCSREFEDLVLSGFREGYLGGTTPNPCILCNPLVKFGVLPRLARSAGLSFDGFATGHYARVERDPASGRFFLKRAFDLRKDQSYFLYRLSQDQLAMAHFPLGRLSKDRVRAIAGEESLPVHDKKESQDFYDGDIADILGSRGEAGDIVDRAGRVLGRHRGVRNYTIGQRKGLGVAFPVPLYVTAIDAGRNVLVVGPEDETLGRSCVVRDCVWIKLDGLTATAEVRVKVRSGGRLVRATISPLDGGRARVDLAEPVSSIAPGQSAVFYDDEDAVVGGGIIEDAA
jgi:tRNA-specific 2-thiouridylase